MNLLLLIKSMPLFLMFAASSVYATERTGATQNIRKKEAPNIYLSTNEQKKNIPLYKNFPGLITTLPHVTLGQFPTPIQHLSNIEKITGAKNLFIKRDDQTSALFGGNTVRKLEFLLGDALNGNALTVLTRGCVGSNHATTTALHAQKIGLKTILCFADQKPTEYLRRNLLLNYHAGAQILNYTTPAQIDADLVAIGRTHVALYGISPYYIPSGGSNKVGVIGYVNAALELKEQIAQGLLPEPDFIYVGFGSGGTAAGLVLGLKLAGLKSKVIAISAVAEKSPHEKENLIKNLCLCTTEYLTRYDANFPKISLSLEDFVINHDFVGDGYALVSERITQAIKLLQEQEQIVLDGTYAGKAWTALVHDVTTQPIKDKTVLFWNTFCSSDFKDITSNIDYHALPSTLHEYFENTLQPFDQGV